MANQVWRLLITFSLVAGLLGAGGLVIRFRSILRPYWGYAFATQSTGIDWEFRFDKLPTQAKSDREPWGGYRWPHYTGGISHRWNATDTELIQRDDKGSFVSFERLADLTDNQLKQLSPAEKFDILRGRDDYPLASHEWHKRLRPAASWLSLAQGWARASIIYQEPPPTTLTTRSGIEIPFGSSDIKGLLAFAQSLVLGDIDLLPLPCKHGGRTRKTTETLPCSEVEAANFHLALTNAIGLLHVPLGVDLLDDELVRPIPVSSYRTIILESTPTSPRELVVETRIQAAVDTEPQWEPRLSASRSRSHLGVRRIEHTLRYRLRLDQQNRIVAGAWIESETRTTIPTRTWLPRIQSLAAIHRNDFGDLLPLEHLYREALGSYISP